LKKKSIFFASLFPEQSTLDSYKTLLMNFEMVQEMDLKQFLSKVWSHQYSHWIASIDFAAFSAQTPSGGEL
jgi:hypothetical protein